MALGEAPLGREALGGSSTAATSNVGSGSANLAGSGSLSGVGTAATPFAGSAPLAGSGSLTGVATAMTASRSAGLTGNGALTGFGVRALNILSKYTDTFDTNPLTDGRISTVNGTWAWDSAATALTQTTYSDTNQKFAFHTSWPRSPYVDFAVDAKLNYDWFGYQHFGFFLQTVDSGAATGYRITHFVGDSVIFSIDRWVNGSVVATLPTVELTPVGYFNINATQHLRVVMLWNGSGVLNGTLYVNGVASYTFTDTSGLYDGARPGYHNYGSNVAYDNAVYFTQPTAEFTGTGTLSGVGLPKPTVAKGFTGDGLLEARGFASYPISLQMQLSLLSDTVSQVPASVVATVTGGWPGDDVAFDIDGDTVYTTTLGVDGAMAPHSIDVGDTVSAGVHTLTVTSLTLEPGSTTSTTFTVLQGPRVVVTPPAPDLPPVDTAPGTVVRRWVLQDLYPGGLGSYTLPRNPSTMTSPETQRVLTSQPTTAVSANKFHVFESGPVANSWSFSGYLTSQAEYDQLAAFCALKRRFYVIDHRGRAWVVVFTGFDARPRKRQVVNGVINDWAHDYTVSALIYDQAGTFA